MMVAAAQWEGEMVEHAGQEERLMKLRTGKLLCM